jgi:hypothetical protein
MGPSMDEPTFEGAWGFTQVLPQLVNICLRYASQPLVRGGRVVYTYEGTYEVLNRPLRPLLLVRSELIRMSLDATSLNPVLNPTSGEHIPCRLIQDSEYPGCWKLKRGPYFVDLSSQPVTPQTQAPGHFQLPSL